MSAAVPLMQGSLYSLQAAALLILAGGLLLLVWWTRSRGGQEKRLRQGLDLIALSLNGETLQEEDIADVVKTAEAKTLVGRFRTFVIEAGGWPAMRLSVLGAVVALVAVWALAALIFLAGPLLSPLIALAIGVFVYRQLMLGAKRRRQMAFLEELPEAIDLIVRVVQAGLPVTDAIGVTGKEMKGPVGIEFAAIAQLVQLGIDLKEALYDAAKRIQLVDFDCFVVSLVVQRETGGQLSEVLGNLSTIVRRRKETRAKAASLTAEGRLTVKVVAALPFVTAAGLTLASPSYMRPLIAEPGGRHMLLAALACLVLGVIVVSRLTKLEV